MAPPIGIKILASCYATGAELSNVERGTTSKALKNLNEDQKKREKIQSVFDMAEKAAMHEGNAKATVDFLRTRERAMQYPKTSATTKIKQKIGISPKTETRTSIIDEATDKFVVGVLGLPADLKMQKKGWRRAAYIEFLHTSVGRLLSLIAGLGSLGIDLESAKVAVHQTLGYGPQAPITGFGRMASEILQILLNDAGKPKLPPQVQNAPEMKEVRKGMKDVKQALRKINPELREAILAAFTPGALPEALEKLKNLRDEVSAEKTKFEKLNDKYTWRFAAFKRQYMGKRWGGVVSAFAGSVASPLTFTIPPAGIAAQAAATFVLQPPAGYADFMKDKYYTLRTAAKKIQLSDLLKKESRGKKLDEITEDDIDIKMASKLYEQKSQAIIGVTREIYRYKLAELMSTQRELRTDIENKNYSSYIPSALIDQKARKEKALQEVTDKIEKLKIQIGYFERGEADKIDPDQTIGKALHNACYFFKNGTMARYNNKVGEFWAQTFQRLGNNFQMLSSIGAMSIVTDMLNILEGHEMINDGIDSLKGDEPHDTQTGIAVSEDGVVSSEGHEAHHAYDVNEEIAAPGILGAQVVAGLVSGSSVIPARDHKDTGDRPKMSVPDWIKMDLKPGGGLRDYLEKAVNKGAITPKKKESIEKAEAQREQSQATGKPLDENAKKILEEWEKFCEKFETNQKNWVVTDIIGKDGKPMTIDLRDSAACYRENVSLTQRTFRVLKAIPPGLISGPALLLDSLKTKRARKATNDLLEQSNQLIAQADEILKEKGQVTDIQDVNSVRRLKSDSVYQGKLKELQKAYSPQEDTFATSEMTGIDLRKIKKEVKLRDSNYSYFSRLKAKTSSIKSNISHALKGDAKLLAMSNQELEILKKAIDRETEKREQLQGTIKPKLKPSEELKDITPRGLRQKWKESHLSKTAKKDKFEDVLSQEKFYEKYPEKKPKPPKDPKKGSEQTAEKKEIHEDSRKRKELGSQAGRESKKLMDFLIEERSSTSKIQDKTERDEGLRQIRNLVQNTQSDPQEMQDQLDMFKSATPAIDQWFNNNNYQVVSNKGDENNCLLIALLQHATGLYEENAAGQLEELARSIREELQKRHGISENTMLFSYPGRNDSGLNALMDVISEKLESKNVKLSDRAKGPVIIVTPFEKKDGTPHAGDVDNHSFRAMNDDEVTNLKQQQMIVYGRNGARHFEAVKNKA